MTTNYHTPIAVGAPANAATFNNPMGQLDAAMAQLAGQIGGGGGGELFDVTKFGAKGDGVANDTVAIQAAIDAAAAAGGGTVYFPGGTYCCLGLAAKQRVSYRGAGGAKLLKTGGGSSTHILDVHGSTTATEKNLSSSADLGTNTLNVANTTGLAVGDYVAIQDNTYEFDVYGQNREMNRIAELTTNTITLTNRTIGSYNAAAGGKVVKLNPIAGVTIRDLSFELPEGTVGGCLELAHCYNVTIDNCEFVGPADDPGIQVTYLACYLTITNCLVRDAQGQSISGWGYGILVEETHHVLIANCRFENIHENPFTCNARLCSFVNNVCRNPNFNGVNTHGAGCKDILIAGNLIEGSRQYGIVVGGDVNESPDRHVLVANNVIVNCAAAGIPVGSELGKELEGISVVGNQVIYPALDGSNQSGIEVYYVNGAVVANNYVEFHPSQGDVNAGILVIYCKQALVEGNLIKACPESSTGISFYNNTDNTVIRGNTLVGNHWYSLRSQEDNQNTIVENNVMDNEEVAMADGELWRGNILAGQPQESSGVAENIGHGDGIPHGLHDEPSVVILTGSVDGEIVSVYGKNVNNIYASVIKPDGSEGTVQTVYWWART